MTRWSGSTCSPPARRTASAGETAPTEELLRALELPAQYTALLISGSNYLGSAPKPSGTVAYFENSPNNPDAGQSVKFDSGFSRRRTAAPPA